MDRGSEQCGVYRRTFLRCSLCVVKAEGTGAVRCKRWHRPRGQSHRVSARGSALFAYVLRQRRATADAHRGRRSSGSHKRICLARLAMRHVGHMCAARCIRRHRPDGKYGPVPSRGSSFLCTYEFWTTTSAHRVDAHQRLSASGFRNPFTMGYTFGAYAASGGGSA